MSAKIEMMIKIKDEIQKDPMGMGYKGKSNAEIAALMCATVRKAKIVYDEYPPRINQILTGVANTPNIVTEQDIMEATNG